MEQRSRQADVPQLKLQMLRGILSHHAWQTAYSDQKAPSTKVPSNVNNAQMRTIQETRAATDMGSTIPFKTKSQHEQTVIAETA